jgi:hypothetical protein
MASGAEYITAISGGSKPSSEEDEGLLNDIEEKMKLLQSMNPVMDSIYNGISIMCSVLMEYKNYMEKDEERSSQRGGGSEPVNWTANIITADGKQAFTEIEGEQIHEFMTTYGGGLLEFVGLRDTAIQSGGSKQAGKDVATQALSSLAEFIDPRKVSLDGAVEFILEYMDMMNDKSEDLAKQVGIIKLQNTIHGIPLQPIGIPYEIPTRLLFILLQGILEVLRLISLFGFPGAGIFRIVGSFLGGLIELFKGDWKSAIFTFMGIAGNGMMTIGLFAKIIVKVMSFMSNGSRDELFYAAYRSTKSLFIGFILFIVSTFASFDIKSLIEQNLSKLGEMLAKIQEQIDDMTKGAQGAIDRDASGCFTVESLKLWPPPEKESSEAEETVAEDTAAVTAVTETRYKSQGLDFDHLIRIQDLFNIPAFFCNETIRSFIDAMKFIPPARIVLELMGIPTTDRAHKSVCINLPQAVTEGEIAAAIMYALRPQIRIKLDPATGLPKQLCAGSEVYGAAMVAQQALSSMFPVGTAGPMSEGIAAGIGKIKSLGAQYKPEGMKVALFGSKLDTSKIPGLSEQKKKEMDQLTSQTKRVFTKAKGLVPDILGVAKTSRGIFLPTTKERMAQTSPTMATLPPGKKTA